jgi:arabinose-5-phosphate isomerase
MKSSTSNLSQVQKTAKPPVDPVEVIATAQRVLKQEAHALDVLASQLNGVFTEVVELFFALRGRVVVTGMGKSGHVCRKIAATLSSTGTPALFVHPGEASHGDLGMITTDDAILALSNSGEASELDALLAYASRFRIPVVGVTGGGRPDNTLARAAHLSLTLPPEPEACPMGLAPTTSTTMMIGLGDAMAVALMERRGFNEDDYRVFHPGGQLGRGLRRVSSLMHSGRMIPLVKPSDIMSEAILVMTRRGFGCAGVVDEAGLLIGIVTDGDLRRHMGPNLMGARVDAVMTKNPMTIAPDELAAKALSIMNSDQRRITALLVVEDAKPVGIVSVHDLLRAGVM